MRLAGARRIPPLATACVLLAPVSAWGAAPTAGLPVLAALQGEDTTGDGDTQGSGFANDEPADGSEGSGLEAESAAGATSEDGEQGATAPMPEEAWLEKENTTYRFVGLRARMVVIPAFMFDLYQADGGKTVVAPVVGVEYTSRRNEFESTVWLAYASWSLDDTALKAKSDPNSAYEIVRSEMKTLSVGADFLWSTQVHEGLSFTYGGGGGLGIVFGSLHRQQAYPTGSADDPGSYVACPVRGAHSFCDDQNDHYGDYTEPSWLDGGSKPVIFPWIALPQLGLRWKVSRQVALRFDTGLSFPGPFFFGLSGQYGLK